MSHAANTDLNNEAAISEDAFAFSGLAEAQAPDAASAFSLTDDADGRFVIDARTGVISVAHRDLVDQERNIVHTVHVHVTEPRGESYEMAVRLKITGMVPRIAGDDLFGYDEAAEPFELSPVLNDRPATFSLHHWLSYAAFAARDGQLREEAIFSGMLSNAPANDLACPPARLMLDTREPLFPAA
jgi:hypothetical protein